MAGLPTGGQYAGAAGLAAGKGEREAGHPPAGRFYGCADAAGGGDGAGECQSRGDEPVADGTSGQGHPSGGAEASAGDGERAAVVYPVLSCGGDEGRKGGGTDRTEGEDGESVPASCAGGAGYGDGGEGDASVPRCAGTGGTAAIPGNQEAKAVGDAMALMEFSTSESQVTEAENIPQPGALVVVKAGEETSRIADKKDKQKNCGEQFWRWLSDGVRSGSLSVNAPDSLVHITGGMIFIPTPEIFLPFLKKHHAAPLLSTEKTFSGNSKNWVVISAKGISHYFSA